MSTPKQDRPDVAVVLCIYNVRRWLTEAIDSILSQTLPDFRLIVVDDGSTDGSGDLVRAYSDARIELIRQANLGHDAARNTGTLAADTEFVAYMDADDVSETTRLAVQREFLIAHPDVAAVGCSIRIVDQTGRFLFTQHAPTGPARCRRRILQGEFYSYGSALMVRRRAALDIGLFRTFFRQRGDVDFMLRLAQRYLIDNVSDVLYRYRMNLQGVSHSDPGPGLYEHRVAYELLRERLQGGSDRLQRGESIPPYAANDRTPPAPHSMQQILYHLHLSEAQLLREYGRNWSALRHVLKAWMLAPLNRQTRHQAMKLLRTRPDPSEPERYL
ncbi:MAG TPA: glycosyltransferase family A protein [Phycisphaerae bacterium]|nr:glycosyltransferase family A protein [Phycisphaerae bacterium]